MGRFVNEELTVLIYELTKRAGCWDYLRDRTVWYKLSLWPAVVYWTEILNLQVARGQHFGRSCDIWACGCVIVEMTTATTPYAGHNITNQCAMLYMVSLTEELCFCSHKQLASARCFRLFSLMFSNTSAHTFSPASHSICITTLLLLLLAPPVTLSHSHLDYVVVFMRMHEWELSSFEKFCKSLKQFNPLFKSDSTCVLAGMWKLHVKFVCSTGWSPRKYPTETREPFTGSQWLVRALRKQRPEGQTACEPAAPTRLLPLQEQQTSCGGTCRRLRLTSCCAAACVLTHISV